MFYMYITNLPFFQTSVPKVDTKFDKLKDTVPRNKDCISAYAKAKDAGEDCAEPPFLHRFWNHEAQEMARICCDTPRNATYNLDLSALSQSYGRCSGGNARPWQDPSKAVQQAGLGSWSGRAASVVGGNYPFQ